MEQLIQIDDARKIVSEILRRVDRLIKAGDVEECLREIIRAKEIYPKHGYIGAYEERLAYLKEEHEKNIALERTKEEAEAAARKRDEELRKEHEKERKRLERKQRRQDARREREEERINAKFERSQESKGSPVSDEQKREITEAKSSTSENRVAGRSQLYSEGSSKNGVEVILVVDDDEQMLESLSHALASEGYETKTLERSDDAYVLLKTWTPSLILCDVNLETSTMGGFSFYEKVRSLDYLNDVPFIFLTGMNDEVMVRTAKELGADDYLMKPISLENLLSTIKGKLRRFGSFREKP